MSRNGKSTCFLKVDQRRSTVDDPDYFKLPQSDSKARKISQPVKIAQLLGSSGKLLSVSKNSAVKISQPERITPYLRSVSTQKKNRTYIVDRLYNERNVRRNLNFAETPPSARDVKNIAKMSKSDDNPVMSKKNLRLSGRKSLLLPPNTIKDKYIRNSNVRSRQSNSMAHRLNETHALTSVAGSKYSKIAEISEDSPQMKKINVSTLQKRNNKTSVIQHTSSRTFDVSNQSGVCSLSSSSNSTNTNNDAMGKKILEPANPGQPSDVKIRSNQDSGCDIKSCKPQVSSTCNANIRTDTELHNEKFPDSDAKAAHTFAGAEKIKSKMDSVDAGTSTEEKYLLKTTIGHEGNSCEYLQAAKTISESNETNLQHDANKDHEYVNLKQEHEVWKSKIINFISRVEKELSDLKMFISNDTLFVNTMNEVTDDTKANNEQQITEHLNNTEAINDLKTPHIIISHDDIETSNAPKEASKILGFDLLELLETNVRDPEGNNLETQLQQFVFINEDNKENKRNSSTPISAKVSKEFNCKMKRRSARLMAKALKDLNTTNDSFANLERELNITNAKTDATIVSNKNCTPIINKSKNKAGRPLREYMALKSRMSCLLTPNIKRLSTLKRDTESDTQLEANDAEVSLSNKIFAEFHNLYADSPDVR